MTNSSSQVWSCTIRNTAPVIFSLYLDIVRGQKKVFKEQDEPVFVPKLNLQKDLFKVYNNAGHLTRFNRQSKM